MNYSDTLETTTENQEALDSCFLLAWGLDTVHLEASGIEANV